MQQYPGNQPSQTPPPPPLSSYAGLYPPGSNMPPQPPHPKRKLRRRTWIIIIIAAFLVISVGNAIASGGKGVGNTADQPTATTQAQSQPTQASQPTSAVKPTAKPTVIAKITAAQKQQVSDILNKNIQHYQQLLVAGKQVLGTTQYADANAGLAAFNDPNSAASKFRDWRHTSNAELDVSYINAFQQADAFYNADNEPAAISKWSDDMGTMQSDLANWVTTAVSWQIRDKTDADLSSAESQFNQDIKQVQADLVATLAAS